jgi:hypothetical protein
MEEAEKRRLSMDFSAREEEPGRTRVETMA